MMFMDMTQYRYIWHKADSSVFNLGIFMSEMHFALINQSQGKVDEIMEKIEQGRS